MVDDADRAADRDDELVEIGRVGRPHGLDGAFVVERPSADERRFAVGATLFVGGAPATVVLSRRAGGGRLAVKLDCPAERGAPLTVRRADLPELAPDRFYVFQLVGLEVIEEGGRPLGRVRDVVSGIANDNLELENGTLVPMVEDAIRSVELDARRIVVSQGFVE